MRGISAGEGADFDSVLLGVDMRTQCPFMVEGDLVGVARMVTTPTSKWARRTMLLFDGRREPAAQQPSHGGFFMFMLGLIGPANGSQMPDSQLAVNTGSDVQIPGVKGVPAHEPVEDELIPLGGVIDVAKFSRNDCVFGHEMEHVAGKGEEHIADGLGLVKAVIEQGDGFGHDGFAFDFAQAHGSSG